MVTVPFLPYWADRAPAAKVTMFCLPHAGGGASAYRGWLRTRGDIDVQPVQLPGREDLIDLPLVDRAEELVDLLGRTLARAADRPFVLFGHSMGAALAAELTAWLAARGQLLPELLVVSSRSGETDREADLTRDLGGADSQDDELMRRVLALNGTTPQVFQDNELRALLLVVMRNDIRLMRAYRPSFRTLPVPIVAFGGDQDTVSVEQLTGWGRRTDSRFRLRTFPGGHFYLQHQPSAVLREISEELGLTGDG